MKYFCTECSYVYDEAFWDEIEEIKPWTKIENIKICPICWEEDSFYFVNEEANYLDENTSTLKELDHFIELEKLDHWKLKVIISENEHSMEKEHRIASVSIFDEYGELVEEKFLEEDFSWDIILEDYDLGDFEIRIKCNRHWVFARKFENF